MTWANRLSSAISWLGRSRSMRIASKAERLRLDSVRLAMTIDNACQKAWDERRRIAGNMLNLAVDRGIPVIMGVIGFAIWAFAPLAAM